MDRECSELKTYLREKMSQLFRVFPKIYFVLCKIYENLLWQSPNTGLGIRSFTKIAQIKWATVRDSLRSLRTNERFAQDAHDKWANRSFIRSLFAHFFSQKRAIRSENRWANSQPCPNITKFSHKQFRLNSSKKSVIVPVYFLCP